MIDQQILEAAVQECNAENEESDEKAFNVIDVFNLPQFTYSNERKKFLRKEAPSHVLFSSAQAKTDMFRDRYTIVYQRTIRHDLFSPSAIGTRPSEQSKKFKLKPVEYLLGSTAKLGEIIVLGMLTQMKEGKWFLEDNSGAVQLDLSRANFHTGLFTENCFVLAEGWYEDEVFHANAFGFPPAESAKTTRAFFGNTNFFGGPSPYSAKTNQKLLQMEQNDPDAMFVFLSDVWLDNMKVMDKLRTLFTGYSEMPPTCFVFCGNFLSQSYGAKQAKTLQGCLKTLADLICEFKPLVEHSRFVFVPGAQDPGPSHILPRPPIPDVLTQHFRERVPQSVFASNPCRLQYCTQEMVIFREDLVMKMCRNCVRFPSEGDMSAHFAKTLVAQSHLCPLPLHVEPVYWALDSALWLFPLPDLVVCADKYDHFSVAQVDCNIVNPGSFPRNDWVFKVYMPATGHVEDSKIEDP